MMKLKKATTLICILLAIASYHYFSNPQRTITNYVKANQEQLEEFVLTIIGSEVSEVDYSYNELQVSYWPESETIEFITHTSGIVAASTYEGFYYSVNDTPQGFQGTKVNFIPKDNGLFWQEPTGDNQAYIENIVGNWYWFRYSF